MVYVRLSSLTGSPPFSVFRLEARGETQVNE
jgi:hypothetical protein